MRYILTHGYIVKDVDKFPNGWNDDEEEIFGGGR